MFINAPVLLFRKGLFLFFIFNFHFNFLEDLQMQFMGVNEIREAYLSFFESKGHLRMASASLQESFTY